MKTMEDLKAECELVNKEMHEAEKVFRDRLSAIYDKTKLLAKFKIGDRVLCKVWSNDKEEVGIIRDIHAFTKYSNKITLCYEVGKITKLGKIHKTHGVGYSRIKEENMRLAE